MNGGRYEPQRPFDEEVSVEIEPDFGYDEIFNPYRKDNK
jgi:hypothetical protein